MSKKVLFSLVIAAVLCLLGMGTAMAQDQAAANTVKNTAPAAQNYARNYRPRIGFGFDGIPFNGSHRAAAAQRRAYRGR